MYLLEKGTKLSLISQVITQPQPSFTLKYDTQLLISKTIQKTSEAMCQDISAAQRMKCMLDQVENKIISTELSCLPFQYKHVFSSLNSKAPPCKDDKDVSTKNINVSVRCLLRNYGKFDLFPQIIWRLLDGHAKRACPDLCQKVEYGIAMSKLGDNYKAVQNKTTLSVRYASPKVKIEEEYTLMSVNAIISATGGSLGLFLGLSCYGVAWKVLETLKCAFKSLVEVAS